MKNHFTTRTISATLPVALLIWLLMLPTSSIGQTIPAIQLTTNIGQVNSLNGLWYQGRYQQGQPRGHVVYDTVATVPGIQLRPDRVNKEALWLMTTLKRTDLSSHGAVLTLYGARFNPAVYVNGQLAAALKGGMGPLQAYLSPEALGTDSLIRLEIRLASLAEVSPKDASNIPEADRWRSNVSSCLWDDVTLRFVSPESHLTRIVPSVDSSLQTLTVGVGTLGTAQTNHKLQVRLLRPNGDQVCKELFDLPVSPLRFGRAKVKLPKSLIRWSPDRPYRYQLEVSVIDAKGQLADRRTIPYGIRYWGMQNDSRQKGFELNHRPFNARAISTVWHRWVRDPEGRALAYDANWIKTHLMQRTKDIGGNTMRFHLGTPPQRYLNWCDSMGLAVQLEWIFFHGMKADTASLNTQWQSWFDMGQQHPSVGWYHPWNETEGPELATAWQSLTSILPDYGRLILAERDLLHVHKYWWGLFENLGLYYDDARQFPLPIMVDEFGGNYLDGKGNLGGYKTLVESYLRFLGPAHTAEQRLKHHTQANVKVAEYWRRLGVAGYSPFCALGSYEDGNHWYLGPLKEGKPKPVWTALTPAYSPVAVSLDLWHRHFVPGQPVSIPVHVINDKYFSHQAIWQVQVVDAKGRIVKRVDHSQFMAPRSRQVIPVTVMMPQKPGRYTIKGWLKNPPKEIRYPVISTWEVLVSSPQLPTKLKGKRIFVPEPDQELQELLSQAGIQVTTNPTEAQAGVIGKATWAKLGSQKLPDNWLTIKRWLWLDVGPQDLGVSYPGQENQPLVGDAFLQGSPQLKEPKQLTSQPLHGLTLTFAEQPEAESHIHFKDGWAKRLAEPYGLKAEDFWVFNGLRGGLAVPAYDMGVTGLQRKALLSLWAQRGADTLQLSSAAKYYAYELSGYYAFATTPNDRNVQQELRKRVKFLAEDAPALKNVLMPDGKITVHDLKATLLASQDAKQTGQVVAITPIAVAGRGLTRTPLLEIKLASGHQIIASQLLSAGRMGAPADTSLRWAIQADPVMQQLILALLDVD